MPGWVVWSKGEKIDAFKVPVPGGFNRVAQPAQDILRLLQRGLAVAPSAGNGVESTMNYRQAQFEQRQNWVLDCYDYACTARFDEHRECDGSYDPDETGAGRAVLFLMRSSPRRTTSILKVGTPRTEIRVEWSCWSMGVEAVIEQRDARNFVWNLHGCHALSGRIEVIIDSTRTPRSDAVRRVRLAPVR